MNVFWGGGSGVDSGGPFAVARLKGRISDLLRGCWFVVFFVGDIRKDCVDVRAKFGRRKYLSC